MVASYRLNNCVVTKQSLHFLCQTGSYSKAYTDEEIYQYIIDDSYSAKEAVSVSNSSRKSHITDYHIDIKWLRIFSSNRFPSEHISSRISSQKEKEAPSNDSVEKIADESSYCHFSSNWWHFAALTSTMNENQFEFQVLC